MEGCIKKSAWYGEASKKFFEEPETDAALRILEIVSTMGLTQEQAEKTLKRACALFEMDRRRSMEETPYNTVHLKRDAIDYLEFRAIERTIPESQ